MIIRLMACVCLSILFAVPSEALAQSASSLPPGIRRLPLVKETQCAPDDSELEKFLSKGARANANGKVGPLQVTCTIDGSGLTARIRCCEPVKLGDCIGTAHGTVNGDGCSICADFVGTDFALEFGYNSIAGFSACGIWDTGAMKVSGECDKEKFRCDISMNDTLTTRLCGDYKGNCSVETTCMIGNNGKCDAVARFEDGSLKEYRCSIADRAGNFRLMCQDVGSRKATEVTVTIPTECRVKGGFSGLFTNEGCSVSAFLNYKDSCGRSVRFSLKDEGHSCTAAFQGEWYW